jgi:hypothetical protein
MSLGRSEFLLANARAHNWPLWNVPCNIDRTGARRSHEQTCGNAHGRSDQMPEHLPAGVKGLDSVIAGRCFATG